MEKLARGIDECVCTNRHEHVAEWQVADKRAAVRDARFARRSVVRVDCASGAPVKSDAPHTNVVTVTIRARLSIYENFVYRVSCTVYFSAQKIHI